MKPFSKTDFNLKPVSRELWPAGKVADNQFAVYLSKSFLVQCYQEQHGIIRLSINRTQRIGNEWKDGITWDELQSIKDALGYQDKDAIEVYPAKNDVVNVANIRHLWVMPSKVAFAWRCKE